MIKYILHVILIILIGYSINISAQPDTTSSGFNPDKYSIDDCVNSFSMEQTEKTKAGYQYWFADKNFLDGRTIKLSVVGPHLATHAPHKHAEDEFFYILEGEAEFFLNGETKNVTPYTSLYCPSNSEHGIRNTGDKELKYLVIKKYNK